MKKFVPTMKTKSLITYELILVLVTQIFISLGSDYYWHVLSSVSLESVFLHNPFNEFFGLLLPRYNYSTISIFVISSMTLMPSSFLLLLLYVYPSYTLFKLRENSHSIIYIIFSLFLLYNAYYYSSTNIVILILVSQIIRKQLRLKDDSIFPFLTIFISPFSFLIYPVQMLLDRKRINIYIVSLIVFVVLTYSLQPIFSYFNDIQGTTRIIGNIGFYDSLLFNIFIGRILKFVYLIFGVMLIILVIKKMSVKSIKLKQKIAIISVPISFTLIIALLSLLGYQETPSVGRYVLTQSRVNNSTEMLLKCAWLPHQLFECKDASVIRENTF